MGVAVITSNTSVGQGKVQFSVNVPLRDIQTIRIVQPKHSRNLSIELIAQSGATSIHVWRKMTSARTNDTFVASTDRISFVAPESASGARVLTELLADIIRDAGGSPVTTIHFDGTTYGPYAWYASALQRDATPNLTYLPSVSTYLIIPCHNHRHDVA